MRRVASIPSSAGIAVHDDEVGHQVWRGRWPAPGRDPDDVDAVQIVQQVGQTVAVDRVVVGDDHTQLVTVHVGSDTLIVVPTPAELMTLVSPPAALTRVAIERSPMPPAVAVSNPQPSSWMSTRSAWSTCAS